ncbi:MAG: dynamin family protein [Nocardioides sp.]
MPDDLTLRIRALAEDARASATGEEARGAVTDVVDRLEGPIRLAISGKVKAGKSTLLNALIGESLAPTDAGECTRIVTWYRYSDRPYALVFPVEGDPVETTYLRSETAFQVDLDGRDAEEIDHLEIGWPTSRLHHVILIDTPGIASISTDVSARTHRALSAEQGQVPVADAVLYLLRHTHSSDLRFLESFHDDEVAEGTPVNTVGVLSRADEIGSARLDAMEVAARVAQRYQGDARLHRLCPIVVPVDGLLGHAAATLREDEYAALVAVAGAPSSTIAELLLTADRFASRDSDVVPVDRRAPLLDRLGLFGVRLCVELIRAGTVTTSSELCARLADLSGLERLRTVVERQFDARARVLKARSAVAALRELFEKGACTDGPALLHRLEQITAGAHEFEEVRVLLELRGGELTLTPERESELDLLMGGSGHAPASRLGLPADAAAEEVRAAALTALAVWQGVERHPLSSRSTQIAARAATRTLEGLLVG